MALAAVMMTTVTRLSTSPGDVEKAGRKHVVRTLGGAVPGSALRHSHSLDSDASDATAVESTVQPNTKQAEQDPALTLLILDGRERVRKPHATCMNVEDFSSHLVDDGEPRWRKTAMHIAVKTTTGRITLCVPSALIAVHAASTLALHVVCLCSSRPVTRSWPWKMDGLDDFTSSLRRIICAALAVHCDSLTSPGISAQFADTKATHHTCTGTEVGGSEGVGVGVGEGSIMGPSELRDKEAT
ncbi:hypothetical protein GGX14DRAFT_565211 [Mycena pura]|uniref:Uncharacterized protein n=1 Tax=Mycena pura TaxID=153505 RepID=A0AAD6VFL5_9AGAR|nr:hypothetical protein GGX14DRAFT_565211 [Mycena pura]